MEKKTEEPKKKAPAREPAAKTKSEDNYTDPDLRERLKEEIKAGDKGGDPGKWSARKSQLLASEYKKAGGEYKKEKPTEKQQDLNKWTEEDWQTSDGKPAKRPGGTTRYLPKEAWEDLSPAEKKATNAKKQTGSKAGKQVVENTKAAKTARKKTTES